MPWYLMELGRKDEPNWYFEDGQNLPEDMSGAASIPDPSSWPIRVRLRTLRKTLPDYTVGPRTGIIVVSKTFKELVEAWDPVKHVFIPIEIRQPDGILWNGEERFIFKIMGPIEGGIVVSKSEVVPRSTPKGTFIGYFSTSQAPRLMWNASAIEGRHIWVDKFFTKGRTVSDEFYEKLKECKIGSFLGIESRIDF